MKKLLVACAGVALLLLPSASYELLRTSQVPKRFPPPGQLVDIDGRKLQIECCGGGSPVVMLETGGQGIFGAAEWGSAFASLFGEDLAGLVFGDAGGGA